MGPCQSKLWAALGKGRFELEFAAGKGIGRERQKAKGEVEKEALVEKPGRWRDGSREQKKINITELTALIYVQNLYIYGVVCTLYVQKSVYLPAHILSLLSPSVSVIKPLPCSFSSELLLLPFSTLLFLTLLFQCLSASSEKFLPPLIHHKPHLELAGHDEIPVPCYINNPFSCNLRIIPFKGSKCIEFL